MLILNDREKRGGNSHKLCGVCCWWRENSTSLAGPSFAPFIIPSVIMLMLSCFRVFFLSLSLVSSRVTSSQCHRAPPISFDCQHWTCWNRLKITNKKKQLRERKKWKIRKSDRLGREGDETSKLIKQTKQRIDSFFFANQTWRASLRLIQMERECARAKWCYWICDFFFWLTSMLINGALSRAATVHAH